MPLHLMRAILVSAALAAMCGCSSWQPTKNVWKSTKGLWNEYVSPPANVDYDDKGSVSTHALALSRSIVGIDSELKKLERTMQNADRPPTQEWLNRLFASYPWLNGFAGVKYDGTILGQEPPDSIKQLDFIPLLYEDSKQHSRALRADVQPGPLGPEILLAAPLYDGTDFLGIVVAYFDMRSIMHFSTSPEEIVVLTPGALLWPGKYEYGSTPLASVNWEKTVRESTAGTCSNSIGSFFYVVHYLGNLPIIFARPEKGSFPEGNGSLEQAANFFPQSREKLPPPPVQERKNKTDAGMPAFEKPEEPPAPEPVPAPPMPEASDRNVIPQGSKDSMLLKRSKPRPARRIEERSLDEESASSSKINDVPVGLLPESDHGESKRPSPFGPGESEAPGRPYQRPSPFGPASQDAHTPANGQEEMAQPPEEHTPAPSTSQSDAPAKEPAGEGEAANDAATEPAAGDSHPRPTLPGGRPSPFGPGR